MKVHKRTGSFKGERNNVHDLSFRFPSTVTGTEIEVHQPVWYNQSVNNTDEISSETRKANLKNLCYGSKGNIFFFFSERICERFGHEIQSVELHNMITRVRCLWNMNLSQGRCWCKANCLLFICDKLFPSLLPPCVRFVLLVCVLSVLQSEVEQFVCDIHTASRQKTARGNKLSVQR
jgi:hypothetical protein